MVDLVTHTAVEEYGGIWVKREDLACPSPGPPFSKMRGLVRMLTQLKSMGVKTVGYVETTVSMAGWGVAWCAEELGMKAVLFEPMYRDGEPELIPYHKKQWRRFGAEIIGIPANRLKINFYRARRILKEKYPDAVMLPLSLSFPGAVDENEQEALRTRELLPVPVSTLVMCVGSGTILSGVLRAFTDTSVYGILIDAKSLQTKYKEIEKKSGCLVQPGLLFRQAQLTLVDPGWRYRQPSQSPCPFPCHPYYDLKAWQWLMEHWKELEGPILFWNIGSCKRVGEL